MTRSLFHTKDDRARWPGEPATSSLALTASLSLLPLPETSSRSPSETPAEDSLLPLPQTPALACLFSALRRGQVRQLTAAATSGQKRQPASLQTLPGSGLCTSFCFHTEWMRTIRGLAQGKCGLDSNFRWQSPALPATPPGLPLEQQTCAFSWRAAIRDPQHPTLGPFASSELPLLRRRLLRATRETVMRPLTGSLFPSCFP